MGESMKLRNISRDELALDYFKEHTVATLAQLITILQCTPMTVYRRLKEWEALSSCNMNGCYHTLPSIPAFNSHGIWWYEGICFSRYGTLKQTVIALARKSPAGMDHDQMEQILGMNPRNYITRYASLPGICKEQHRGRIIYFSDDCSVYAQQKRRRVPPAPSAEQLPDDAAAVLILVTRIQHPEMGAEAIAEHLKQQGHPMSVQRIDELFRHYGIDKKKLNMKS